MLPLQKLEDTDDLMNQPPEDDDLLFSTSESNEKKQIKTNKNKQKVTRSGWHRSSASFLFSFELVQQTAFAALFAVTLLGFNQLCLA